ncbi:hypothetical protein ACSX1A_20225 [Pontibacter sp. MBLB2868]|uniref:hypothetical protein n=1 Tax=Pontibacter sp. MBLB2868 TaxID=3451555 RepID=UPI003F74C128
MSEPLLLCCPEVVLPEDLPVLESVVLLSFLEEPAFAFVVEDFDPVVEADVLLLPLFDEEPVEPLEELEPLLLPVVPDELDNEEGEFEESPDDKFDDWFEL